MPRTILLADDSVTIRKVVELTFSDTDIRVDSVGSGAEAIARLSETAPDLVLADVVMPAPTGYEICSRIKASSRPVPVLLLAGTFEPFDEERARSCGADGHLVKPFESRTLVDRVERLLAATAPRPIHDEDDRELDAVFEELAGVDSGGPEPPLEIAPEAEAPDVQDGSAPEPAFLPEPVPAVASEPSIPEPEISVPPAVVEPVEPAGGVHSVASEEGLGLSDAEIDAIARAVVARLSDRVLREIAWDVVPDLAEIIVRERIRELEREDEDRG